MYKKTILPNGLRIITLPMPNTKTATVLVLVATGSKYETKEINGISHFLEHMTFKGTEKRPSPLAIADPLDRIGSQYNAFTGQEYTGYYAKADGRHLDLLLDIISDITSIPITDNSFDAIMCVEVFEHIPEPAKAVKEFCKSNQIDVIDLFVPFRNYMDNLSRTGRLSLANLPYFEKDGHVNEVGQKIIAKEVLNYFENKQKGR